MKKYIFVTVLVISVVLLSGAYLETVQKEWTPIRTLVTTDDGVLDGTTASLHYTFTDKPARAVKINELCNAGELYFYGLGDDTDTVAFKVYMWRSNGPAKLIYQGTTARGPAEEGTTDTYYCDTITEVANFNSCSVTDSGNNRIAILSLGDLKGYVWLYVEFDVTAGQMTSVNCAFSSY